MNIQTVEVDLDGRKLTIETGKIAKQAHGSVVVRCGDSVVLVSACTAPKPKPNQSFFPLTCDYREYTYSAGKIPGRLHQARRAHVGKGNAHQPDDRPPDAAVVPGRLSSTRLRSLRWCSRPIRNMIPACSPSSAQAPRSPFPIFRSTTLSARCASAWWMVNTSRTPPTSRPAPPS